MIDLITIESLVKAVRIKEEPVKGFVHTVDSLNQKWDLSKIRDPFVTKKKAKPARVAVRKKATPPKKPRIKRPKITISGIVWDKLKPYVIINGEIRGVGDRLGGYSIHTILDSLVTLASPIDTFNVKYKRD